LLRRLLEDNVRIEKPAHRLGAADVEHVVEPTDDPDVLLRNPQPLNRLDRQRTRHHVAPTTIRSTPARSTSTSAASSARTLAWMS
jgi:hypothetical protein